ncbi:nitronate monooxygenase [Opitutus terrae]|uniref:2-nitropropane dioxygenase, NPD n=1 Tax=Opitutus terrae (strain DSM 11246 / JCM 15787 / PB90-1) TaxID=452637 RepID=B1ZXP7_OPITP|nr:nitronate monooxygenase [Opitutus terrae]ACB74269.1 2-nitropropane dioxygenase, NPD [Opitutus terrae PB90-1]
MKHPEIIQGGMGIAVSNWRLAKAVSRLGELGVVSGTALGIALARRLQLGDAGGHMRRALQAFPVPAVAERLMAEYFVPGGKPTDTPFRSVPMPTLNATARSNELTVAGSFVEVFLAKEGHAGHVGINLLEKVQLPTLPALFGAMLAKVDYVLMGAGIPRAIPGVLDRLAAGQPAELKIDVAGAVAGEDWSARFDPAAFCDGFSTALRRPFFLAIVASATLAMTLAKKSSGQVDGFVVESEIAGGHNAPPRGALQLSASGEPVYGPRDVPELQKIRELGLPFWLAGSYASPAKLAQARALGAAGIQVGTAFAFCDESGVDPALKLDVIRASRAGGLQVFTDPFASPTGFPFKVVGLPGTMSEAGVYAARERRCDLGFLRQAYRKDDGTVGYRCAAERVEDYVRKGGKEADTVGRKCLCNGLAATVGFAQIHDGVREPAIVTAGNELTELHRLMRPDAESYSAADVLNYLRGAT